MPVIGRPHCLSVRGDSSGTITHYATSAAASQLSNRFNKCCTSSDQHATRFLLDGGSSYIAQLNTCYLSNLTHNFQHSFRAQCTTNVTMSSIGRLHCCYVCCVFWQTCLNTILFPSSRSGRNGMMSCDNVNLNHYFPRNIIMVS